MGIIDRIKRLETESSNGTKDIEPLYVTIFDKDGHYVPNPVISKETLDEAIRILEKAGVLINGGDGSPGSLENNIGGEK